MKGKINVGILFGGKSAEHEVSIQSAKNIYDAIDQNKYQITMIGISKTGKWFLVPPGQGENIPPRIDDQSNIGKRLAVIPGDGESQLVDLEGHLVQKLDVVFPVLHGPFGEDGTVQGLLKLANIPFVGPGVLGAAVGMDKEVMKRLLKDAKLPIADYLVLYKYPDQEANPTYQEIVSQLGTPFFVKPANLGSSVGISKVHNEDQFNQAVEEAFRYDLKLVVEKNIVGQEIECAVLGNEHPQASKPGEIVSSHSFYSYEAKYLDEHGAQLEIPAKLSQDLAEKIQEAAVRTFQVLCCEGLARVDFFVGEKGDLIINEINTIPGFTKISMYPKLWEVSGISYTELIDRLIGLALEKSSREKQLMTSR